MAMLLAGYKAISAEAMSASVLSPAMPICVIASET